MKYIHKYKSPNYNHRKSGKLKFLVIHYTALNSVQESLTYLCNKKNKVSCHYLISQNGEIFSLVNEKFRAWHAGVSFWDNCTDINSTSIGIELDYNPNGQNNKFTKKMIKSLINLINKLKKKYNIKSDYILGHSDIAPFRKIDPGINFPWELLSNANIVVKNKSVNNKKIIILKQWFKKNNIRSKKKIIYFILSYIGYDTKGISKKPYLYLKLINTYNTRFIRDRKKNKLISINIDIILKQFFNFLLTKK